MSRNRTNVRSPAKPVSTPPPKAAQPASAPAASGPPPLPPEPLSWAVRLKPWLLRALSLSSAASTLLLLIYYWRIGYFPLEGLPDLAAFSALVLASAALLTISLLVFWCGPSLALAGLLSELGLQARLSSAAAAGLRVSAAWKLGAVAIGLPWLSWTVFLVAEILDGSPNGWGLMAASSWLSVLLSQKLWQRHGGSRWRWGLLTLAVGLATSMPLWLLLMLSRNVSWLTEIERLEAWQAAGTWFAVLLLAGLALWACVVATILHLTKPEGPPMPERLLAIAAMHALLLAGLVAGAGLAPTVLEATMRASHLRVERVDMVLKPDWCAALSGLGVTGLEGAARPVGACIWRQVTIASRLGERWWLQCPMPGEAAGHMAAQRGFELPSEARITWSRGGARWASSSAALPEPCSLAPLSSASSASGFGP